MSSGDDEETRAPGAPARPAAPDAAGPDERRSSGTHRLGRIAEPAPVLLLALLAVAAVTACQAWTVVRWLTCPWPGFTLAEHGRVSLARPEHAPGDLSRILADGPVHARAIAAASGAWVELEVPGQAPWAASARLTRALRPLAVGEVVRMRFATPAGEREASLALRALPASVGFERGVLLPFIGLLLAGLGGLVYHARPGAREAVLFALFAGLTALELIAGSVAGGPHGALRLLEVAAAALAPAAALGLAALLDPRPWLARRPWLLLLPWAASGAVLLIDAHLERMGARPALAVLRLVALALFTSYVLWLRATTPSRNRRRELGFYLAGMAAAFALPVVVYSLPRTGAVDPTPWVVLPVLLFPATIGYGILRHRLLDIDLVLRRGALYALLSGAALLIYGSLVAATSVLLEQGGAVRSPIVSALFVMVAIVAGGALRSRLQRVVDRRLAPERYRYLEAVRQAGTEMATLDSEQAVAASLARTATAVAGLRGAVVLLDRGGQLEVAAHGGPEPELGSASFSFDEPLVRLARLVSAEVQRSDFDDNPRLHSLRDACLARMDGLGAELLLLLGAGGGAGARPLGLLALGPRRDLERFNREDLDLFRTLAAQAALGLARARARRVQEAPTEAVLALAPGSRLLHYRLEAPLGRGGAGTVWRALDEKLDRPVAIKLLHPERAAEAVTVERLRREARTLAALSHPNIVQIHALEELDGRLFLAIELVDGSDLRQFLAEAGPRSPRECAEIAAAVASALGFALERAVIHRDVKLSNILRTRSGAIKLTDFGLARPAPSASAASDASLTGAGLVVGTMAYLAPELLAGRPADHRADLYALGIVIHELVTGRNPWPDSALNVRQQPGSLSALAKPLQPIVRRLIDPDPERRYQEYHTLIADLARVG